MVRCVRRTGRGVSFLLNGGSFRGALQKIDMWVEAFPSFSGDSYGARKNIRNDCVKECFPCPKHKHENES